MHGSMFRLGKNGLKSNDHGEKFDSVERTTTNIVPTVNQRQVPTSLGLCGIFLSLRHALDRNSF